MHSSTPTPDNTVLRTYEDWYRRQTTDLPKPTGTHRRVNKDWLHERCLLIQQGPSHSPTSHPLKQGNLRRT